MESNFNLGYPEVPFSITNNSVLEKNARDKQSPFSLLDFIKNVGNLVDNNNVSQYYNFYLTKWNIYKNNKPEDTKQVIVQAYTGFIKDLAYSYNTEAENKFLSQIDYSNPYDLDIALSFIARKIKEIALYYSKQREGIKLETYRKKFKGSVKGTQTTLKEKIIDFIANLSNKIIPVDATKVDIHIDELYDTSTNYFNKEPNVAVNGANTVDYNEDIFLKSNLDLVADIFINVSDTFKQFNEVENIFDNKRDLTKKYMGADYYYATTVPLLCSSPTLEVNSNYTIRYNKQNILDKIIPIEISPCKCITIEGPVVLSYIECGTTSISALSVYQGEIRSICMANGGPVSASDYTKITTGNICTSSIECIQPPVPQPPTTKPGITIRPPAKPRPQFPIAVPAGPGGGGPKPPDIKPPEEQDCNCKSIQVFSIPEAFKVIEPQPSGIDEQGEPCWDNSAMFTVTGTIVTVLSCPNTLSSAQSDGGPSVNYTLYVGGVDQDNTEDTSITSDSFENGKKEPVDFSFKVNCGAFVDEVIQINIDAEFTTKKGDIIHCPFAIEHAVKKYNCCPTPLQKVVQPEDTPCPDCPQGYQTPPSNSPPSSSDKSSSSDKYESTDPKEQTSEEDPCPPCPEPYRNIKGKHGTGTLNPSSGSSSITKEETLEIISEDVAESQSETETEEPDINVPSTNESGEPTTPAPGTAPPTAPPTTAPPTLSPS